MAGNGGDAGSSGLEAESTTRPMPVAEWPEELRRELEATRQNGHVGGRLVHEDERVRVWHLSIAPGERLGFHVHVLDYFWTVTSPGRGRSHYADGRVAEVDYAVGDVKLLRFGAGERMQHDLVNVGDTPLYFVTTEFKQSTNPPLPL